MKFPLWVIPAFIAFVAAIPCVYLTRFGGDGFLYWVLLLVMFASAGTAYLLIAHNLKKKKPLLAEYIKSFVYAMAIILGVALFFKVSGQW